MDTTNSRYVVEWTLRGETEVLATTPEDACAIAKELWGNAAGGRATASKTISFEINAAVPQHHWGYGSTTPIDRIGP